MGGFPYFFKNCYSFTYACPNGSGVSAIDRSYLLEHVFEPYCTLEPLRKFFMDKVWTIRPQKTAKNSLFWPFIRVLESVLYYFVQKNFSEDFQCAIWFKNMFRWIRSINRTNPRPIWTLICNDIAIL